MSQTFRQNSRQIGWFLFSGSAILVLFFGMIQMAFAKPGHDVLWTQSNKYGVAIEVLSPRKRSDGSWCSETLILEVETTFHQYYGGNVSWLPGAVREVGAKVEKACPEAQVIALITRYGRDDKLGYSAVHFYPADRWKARKSDGWRLQKAPVGYPDYVNISVLARVKDRSANDPATEIESGLKPPAASPEARALVQKSIELRGGKDSDDAQAISAHKLALAGAKSGDPEGLFLVGLDFWSGRGTTQNLKRAQHALRAAAKLEHPFAPHSLGLIYQEMGKHDDAISWFWRGSFEEGRAGALNEFKLAQFYWEGKHVKKNRRIAYVLAASAARRGLPEGILYQASMLVEVSVGSGYIDGMNVGGSGHAAENLRKAMPILNGKARQKANELLRINKQIANTPTWSERENMQVLGIIGIGVLGLALAAGGSAGDGPPCAQAALALGGCDPTHISLMYYAYYEL